MSPRRLRRLRSKVNGKAWVTIGRMGHGIDMCVVAKRGVLTHTAD